MGPCKLLSFLQVNTCACAMGMAIAVANLKAAPFSFFHRHTAHSTQHTTHSTQRTAHSRGSKENHTLVVLGSSCCNRKALKVLVLSSKFLPILVLCFNLSVSFNTNSIYNPFLVNKMKMDHVYLMASLTPTHSQIPCGVLLPAQRHDVRARHVTLRCGHLKGGGGKNEARGGRPIRVSIAKRSSTDREEEERTDIKEMIFF